MPFQQMVGAVGELAARRFPLALLVARVDFVECQLAPMASLVLLAIVVHWDAPGAVTIAAGGRCSASIGGMQWAAVAVVVWTCAWW